jgi:nucleoside-diphosphate-sugar epimerase
VAETVLITGGAGYIGAPLCRELLAAGCSVRVLDALLHGQEPVAGELERDGVELTRGDIRDRQARRRALAGMDAVVHLAAVVGDPACARDPELAHAINVEAASALIEDAAEAGVAHMVFASTCSNYGRMADPETAIDEDGELRPVSLYAEQKVAVERLLLDAEPDGEAHGGGMRTTCLRLATVYGVAPRMRFDLTVNEFTRDLWAERPLEVFGELFWRPYVHVGDVARAVRAVLESETARPRCEVFNVGCTQENYRKLDLVRMIGEQLDTGSVTYVQRAEDPRDYKVNFEKIRRELGFETAMTVRDGVREVLGALTSGAIPDPFDDAYRNVS